MRASLECSRRGISGHLLVFIILVQSVVRLCGVGRWIRFRGSSGHLLVISVVSVESVCPHYLHQERGKTVRSRAVD